MTPKAPSTLRRLAVALLVLASAATAHAAPPRYTLKPGVRLTPHVEAKVAAIAERYHAATKRTLLITSGTRSPHEQAAAMYGKLKAGDRLYLYRMQSSVAPLRAAYDRGRRKRAKPDVVIREMAALLAAQVERGVFISRHLRGNAFDVRSHDLKPRQRRAFLAAVAAVGGVTVLEERRPPHFHCEVRAPKASDAPDPPEADEDAPDAGDGEGEASSDAPPPPDAPASPPEAPAHPPKDAPRLAPL